MIELSVKSLSKHYAETKAVDSIDFTVPAGSLFTLLGESGCGKTTTLRMVAGLETPTAGNIFFGDEDFTSFPPHRREIGMVFQSYALFPHLTVFENVAYGLRVRKTDGKTIENKVREVLELVGLEHTAHRKPAQLSGGQQQRIALARALVYDPKILLLDEPLSNLDAKLRVYMRDEIRKIQQRAGITTLYVTHDQEEALSISDYIAVMHRGVIAQLDSPYEIYERPKSVLVADFIGRANFVNVKIATSDDECHTVIVNDSKLAVGRCEGPSASFAAGSPGLLFFRPEKATITIDEVPGQSVPCTIAHILYLGESVRYTLILPDNQEVFVSLNRRVEDVHVGSDVYLVLQADDATLFPDEQKRFLKRGN